MGNLEKESKKIDNGSIFVGFSERYAIYVHEDLTKHHEPPTQAKFLEEPFLQYQKQMFEIAQKWMRKGFQESTKNFGNRRKRGLVEGLFEAGHFLLKKVLPITPKETGDLRESAFVDVG